MKPYRAIAEYYDAEYAEHPLLVRDIAFFIEQLPKKSQRVLDVACGTGRSSIPIAQAGHRVVGADYANDMLDIARFKRDSVGLNERQLKFVHQDAMKLKLVERFDFAAIFFNTFLSFTTLEKQDRVLRGIHKHLRPRGKLWLDIFQPSLEILAQAESKDHDPSIFYVPSLGRSVQRTADLKRDAANQVSHVTFHYRWFDERGRAHHERRSFDLTFIFARELRILLERNGFVVEKTFGDHRGATPSDRSPRIIALARKR